MPELELKCKIGHWKIPLLARSCDGFWVQLREPKDVKIATFNLSFDRKTFENLVAEMLIEPEEQNELVMDYLNGILTVFLKSVLEFADLM